MKKEMDSGFFHVGGDTIKRMLSSKKTPRSVKR